MSSNRFNSKQIKEINEAIDLLKSAHDISVKEANVEDLVDIHNQLAKLHYLNNDEDSFQKSLKFAQLLASKVNYKRGLEENEAVKNMIETNEIETSILLPVSSEIEEIKNKESFIEPIEKEVKKSIFDILPTLKIIFGQTGIPLIEIEKEINYDFKIIAKVIKQMIAKGEIMGFLDHRQTVSDLSDDILYLESEPSFQCEICKSNQKKNNPHYKCKQCGRNACENCYTQMNLVGHNQCSYCGSNDFSYSQ